MRASAKLLRLPLVFLHLIRAMFDRLEICHPLLCLWLSIRVLWHLPSRLNWRLLPPSMLNSSSRFSWLSSPLKISQSKRKLRELQLRCQEDEQSMLPPVGVQPASAIPQLLAAGLPQSSVPLAVCSLRLSWCNISQKRPRC